MSTHAHNHAAPAHRRSRSERFFAGTFWLILKNVIGWALILASFVIGPFIPGPGGIPMFLIGFALVTFPGKRHLTSRVLRGKRFHFWSLRMMLITVAFAIAAPGLVLWIFSNRWEWLSNVYRRGPWAIVATYLLGVIIAWLLALGWLYIGNLFVRILPRIRRKVRPWLRHHHVRLLPPRRRPRHPHEHGAGPLRLKDEILGFFRHTHRAKRKTTSSS